MWDYFLILFSFIKGEYFLLFNAVFSFIKVWIFPYNEKISLKDENILGEFNISLYCLFNFRGVYQKNKIKAQMEEDMKVSSNEPLGSNPLELSIPYNTVASGKRKRTYFVIKSYWWRGRKRGKTWKLQNQITPEVHKISLAERGHRKYYHVFKFLKIFVPLPLCSEILFSVLHHDTAETYT